jgi:hypothetical protein
VPDDKSFVWPAAGDAQVIVLPGGGCNMKFSFSDRGTVRSVGKGRITTIRNVPTKRIAQQYEIVVRHDDDFESIYSIIDQSPHLGPGDSGPLKMQGALVDDGSELYDIRNGGTLHFQLYRAGRLIDPRTYMRPGLFGAVDASRQSP